MREIYEEACKEGTMKVYRTRIMLVGHFAAGKTSVKRSLLNEEFVPMHLTTEGVETEETVNVVVTHVKDEGKGSLRWEKVRFENIPIIHTNYRRMYSQVDSKYQIERCLYARHNRGVLPAFSDHQKYD